MTAYHLGRGEGKTALVIGADEYHEKLSGLFDPSVQPDDIPSAGGGALILASDSTPAGVTVFPGFSAMAENHSDVVAALVQSLGGSDRIKACFGVLLAGIPGAHRSAGAAQLEAFLASSGFKQPVIEYRKLVGEFASASAVAAFMAVNFTQAGTIPGPLCNGRAVQLSGKGCLVLGLGKFVTAMEVVLR